MKTVLKTVLAGFILAVMIGCAQSAIKPEDYNKLKQQNADLQAANDNLKGQNDSMVKDLALLKDQLSAAQDQRDKMQDSLMQLSNTYTKLKNLNDNSKTDLGKQIDALQASIRDKDGQIKNLNGQIDDLNQKLVAVSSQDSAEMKKDQAEIDTLSSNLQSKMNQEINAGNMQVQQSGDVLSIDFVDKIFFDSGSADIKKNGKDVLNKVVSVLKNVTNKQIRVEGYTDNVPIGDTLTWKFPSNWELSTSRATTIVRYLQSQGISPALLKATGYGEYNPVASNDTEEGKAQNRRIVIQLVPLDVRARYR